MKRPLFAVCLAITCVIACYYWLNPPLLQDRVSAGAEEILLYGRVDRKENRISYGKEQLILYLTEYSVYSDNSIDSEFNASVLQEKSTKGTNQIMCYMPSTTGEPKTGSFVLVRGKPEDFDTASNPGEFDSRLYYATLGIDFCVKSAEVLWESDTYSVLKEGLWKVRCRCRERLDEVLSEEAASVQKAMLLGDKTAPDGEVKALYQDGGIAHILAISGLHISIIGMGFYRLLRKMGMPIWLSAMLGSTCILAYGIMTGAGVSTGRAMGMFLIRMLAEILGRSYDMLTALGVLLLVMVLRQPLYVCHSGFLLSFTALFGIGLLYPALERGDREQKADKKPKRYREGLRKWGAKLAVTVKGNFLTSLSVTLATLPVTFWFFYETPVYGVVLNLLVLPWMPAVLYMGLGILFLPKGVWLQIPAWIVEGILEMVRRLCEYSLSLPGQNFIRGRPKVWQVVVYVALLVAVLFCSKKRGKGGMSLPLKGRLAVLGAAVFVLCVKCPEDAKITFLDVGQGDSICIQTAGGNAYLIDCGSSSQSQVGKYVVAPFLKYEGISYLEAVIITHPDADHCNGLENLLEEGYAGRIGVVLLPDILEADKTEAYLELESLATSYKIPVGYLSEGMAWQDDNLTFTCLHPGKAGYANDGGSGTGTAALDDNEYSVVLHVEGDGFSALLTGDVEDEGEKKLAEVLAAKGIDSVTALKVAHHGSRNSTTEDFLEVLDAGVAIISCGAGNTYGHPHEETLLRLLEDGAVILTTSECGAVTIKFGESGVTCEMQKAVQTPLN